MTTESTLAEPDDYDLLAPFVQAGGLLIGYARVSTKDQNLDRQLRALKKIGCAKIFSDKLSGKNTNRPELTKCMEYARPGDTIVVTELSRLGRSLQDLINLVGQLRRGQVAFMSLKEHIDTTTAGGRLIFHVFASLAEFIRELILEGTKEGLDAARARGQRLGRPPALSPEQVRHARHMLTAPDATIASIAKLLGVNRGTLYNHLPELRGPGWNSGGAPAEIPTESTSDAPPGLRPVRR